MKPAICRDDCDDLFQRTDLAKELVDFTRRQIVNATMYRGDEQRHEGRHLMMIPVRVVEVDQHNVAIGEPVELISRDLSASSIGLVHTDPIDAERLALNFHIAGTAVMVVIHVVWSGPMGPFYGVAGRFVAKLNAFPSLTEDRHPQAGSRLPESSSRHHSPGTFPSLHPVG